MSEPNLRAQAHIATAHASKYLQQLCKHFQHKLPATFDETSGAITFSTGETKLAADAEMLTLALEAPNPEDLEQLKDVVARHLLRFAFREALDIEWRTGA
jgi:uncharacterized protein